MTGRNAETTFAIRRLGPEDARLYHPVRLEGLRDHPSAFGAEFETERAMGLDAVAARLDRGATWGAFDGEELLGVTSFFVNVGAKVRHKGTIVAVYVRPAARGKGLARALVQTALEHACGRVELVQLGVAQDNDAARRLYESLGFAPYGTEPRAYKLADRYVDDLLMWREI